MNFNILMIDDDEDFVNIIKDYNKDFHYNYDIYHLSSGEGLIDFLQSKSIHLIIMDWHLNAELSGIDLVKDLKTHKATSGIFTLFLTGSGAIEDEIVALNSGADVFLRKPIELELLFTYINVMLRKVDTEKNAQNVLMRKFNLIDESQEVEYMGENHKLTNKEFVILKTLVEHPGKTFSQDDLNNLSSPNTHVSKRCIDVFVTNIRNKIGKKTIVSIKKRGYTINPRLFQEA